MNEPSILVDEGDGFVTLTINRPAKRNALDTASADALTDAIRRAGGNRRMRVLVLRGAGDFFSSGFDLASFDPDGDEQLGSDILQNHFEGLVQSVRESRLTVVSAMNGPAAGVSVALALAGDLVIAARSAYFYVPFLRLGVVPDGGNTWLLPRLLGPQRAAGLALLGERLPAEEAERQGLIWRCFDDAEFDAGLERLVARLVALPDRAREYTKRALEASASNTFVAQLLLERRFQDECGRDPDFREGVESFLGKREPRFRRD